MELVYGALVILVPCYLLVLLAEHFGGPKDAGVGVPVPVVIRHPQVLAQDGSVLIDACCGTCVYGQVNAYGRLACHLNPPQRTESSTYYVNGWPCESGTSSVWPLVDPDEGCSHHTLPGYAPTFFH